MMLFIAISKVTTFTQIVEHLHLECLSAFVTSEPPVKVKGVQILHNK